MKKLVDLLRNTARVISRRQVQWRSVILIIALATSLILNALFLWRAGFAGRQKTALPDAEQQGTDVGSSMEYRKAAAFALYAMKLREEELSKIEPQTFVPTSSKPAARRFPWKMNIVTNVFWIGQRVGIFHALSRSAWDPNWMTNYGGFDTPDSSGRRDYIPLGFIPRQNPFYCALPYNDVAHGQFKPEAPLVIPWFKQGYTGPGESVCKSRWIAIRKGNRTCYAQWEDCGPFGSDHFQYVFQNERPKPNAEHGAGLSVSPSVRDYLGLAPTDVTDWQFVEVRDVPPGPWRNYGENNHFVLAKRQMEQSVREVTPSQQN